MHYAGEAEGLLTVLVSERKDAVLYDHGTTSSYTMIMRFNPMRGTEGKNSVKTSNGSGVQRKTHSA